MLLGSVSDCRRGCLRLKRPSPQGWPPNAKSPRLRGFLFASAGPGHRPDELTFELLSSPPAWLSSFGGFGDSVQKSAAFTAAPHSQLAVVAVFLFVSAADAHEACLHGVFLSRGLVLSVTVASQRPPPTQLGLRSPREFTRTCATTAISGVFESPNYSIWDVFSP